MREEPPALCSAERSAWKAEGEACAKAEAEWGIGERCKKQAEITQGESGCSGWGSEVCPKLPDTPPRSPKQGKAWRAMYF